MTELLDVQAGLPEQYSVIGEGGQYRALMLTGNEQAVLSVGAVYEAPNEARVLKLPLLRHEVEVAVEGMSVSEQERAAKVGGLIRERNIAAMSTIHQVHQENANGNSRLRVLFANPRLIATDYRFEELDISTHAEISYEGSVGLSRQYAGYTQTYAMPVASRLQSADTGKMRQLVDDYTALQRELVTYGLFDCCYKFADNCGETPSGDFVMFDFGELARSQEEVYESLQQKSWEETMKHLEYTQLPPELYEYLCDSLERALPTSIIDSWGIGATQQESAALPAYDIIQASTMRRILQKAGLYL